VPAFQRAERGQRPVGLQTRAEDKGDPLRRQRAEGLDTLAHVAKWCMLVTRERKESNPRDRLDLPAGRHGKPRGRVRPLVQITGDAEFNEIFFKDVKVSKSQILGEAGNGWAVAMTTLLHERGTLGMALATRAQITAAELSEHARKLGRGSDPLVRQKIAQFTIEARALQLQRLPGRHLGQAQRHSRTRRLDSQAHVVGAQPADDRERPSTWPGPAGQVEHGDGWLYQFLRSRANTIEAGTSEVLRNILAERVLGLPRSR